MSEFADATFVATNTYSEETNRVEVPKPYSTTFSSTTCGPDHGSLVLRNLSDTSIPVLYSPGKDLSLGVQQIFVSWHKMWRNLILVKVRHDYREYHQNDLTPFSICIGYQIFSPKERL